MDLIVALSLLYVRSYSTEYNKIRTRTWFTFQVSFSMLEIYNEQIRDLLNTSSSQKSLQLRQSPSMGFYVQGLTQIPVGSYKEVEQRMKQGTAKRTIAATNMNETSSRAHTLVTLTFDQLYGEVHSNGSRKRSIINLVDLAGTRRWEKSCALS
ncbi:hypothetical protein CRM22_010166 [Opisthorchis felineus]|uniref:Kinesin motor domain-containing protein n=1 Tax=Opisthorchis felineus TaxID=147828 RepID=A0A4S2L1A5_OPIFE|nr:hypothetical protein CRM22_010166 [Opisthorchis felineus]